jgi:hypothetical protein
VKQNLYKRLLLNLQLKAKHDENVVNYLNSERLTAEKQTRWAVVCSEPIHASVLQFAALLTGFASNEDENLQACGTRLQYPREDSQWMCGKYEISSSQGWKVFNIKFYYYYYYYYYFYYYYYYYGDEVKGDLRKLHNEELHSLCSLPSIIRMKSRMMRWVGHVARMGRRGLHKGYWWESQKERDH